MPRVRRFRRLTSAAALLAVGALVLTGCRSDPQVAAYVGGTRYSDDRVTSIADEAHDKLQEAVDQQSGASAQPVERPVSDQDVVAALLGRDLLKAVAQEKNIGRGNLSANDVAQQVGVPPDTEYVRIVTERDSYRLALLQQLPESQPSEATLREVYDNSTRSQQFTGSLQDFESFLGESDEGLIGRVEKIRGYVQEKVRQLNVTVNPRYGPADLHLFNVSLQQGAPTFSLLDVSLDNRESGVRDIS